MVETTQENLNPELAMREQCAKHGEFKKKEDGNLEFKDYLVARGIIARQAARMYRTKREELDEKKLECFKAGNDFGYLQVFREAKHNQE